MRKYWIVVLISALLLAGFGSTLLTSYFVAYKSVGDEINKNTLPLTSDNVYSSIQKDLVLSIHISSLMAHDIFARDWVLAGEADPEQMVRYITEIQQKYNTVTAFFVSDITGMYYHPDGILKKVSKDDPRDAWYFRTRGLNMPYEINIDTDTADQNRITVFINHQVYGYDNELIGVTGVGLELSQVREVLNIYQQKFESRVIFVDNSGKIVLHANDFDLPPDLYKWRNFHDKVSTMLSNPEASFDYTTGRQVFFVSSRYIPEFDLFLVILKENKLKAKLSNRLQLNFAIGLLITVVVVGIVAVILKKYNQNLERLASIDPLTNTYNRSAFSLIFAQAIKEKKRRGSHISMILMDIDDFKNINDKYGHPFGDLALATFAQTVMGVIRETDVLCRWGGEEFVVLLVDCSLREAVSVAKKIGKITSGVDIRSGRNSVRLTISAGVVAHREDETLSHLIARADALMYEAKFQGKNRAVSEDCQRRPEIV